jgi:hypothetical protein
MTTTSPTASAPSPADELVTFIQHDLPGLDAGEYQLRIAQQVNDSAGAPISDDTLAQTYTLAVVGDRFRLKDPSTVYSVFPAANASGEFTAVLPHVVFTRSTFPWIRYPTNEEPFTPPAPGQDTDADVPTWLTVLLLDEDDAAAFPGLALPPVSATLGDLYPPSLVPTSTLGSNVSYFQDASAVALDPGDQLTDTIQVLDIPLGLFWQLAPTIADLDLMAHVRQVSLTNKATMAGISDVGEPLGTFSIVFGNRFPADQKKTYAYLVSLEELQDYLPTSEDGGPPAGTRLDPATSLRLAVLTSWTFYSTGQPAAFVNQVLALNGATAGEEAPYTTLRLPYAGSDPVIGPALEMGYVPLNHNVRTGEKTVSWYRGPLAPYAIAAARVRLPVASPDQATIFDPTTGMLDTSYAAAWTLGRLMALQDTGFSTALYNWKIAVTQEVVDQVENAILGQTFASVLQRAPVQLPQLVQAGRIRATPAGDLLHMTIQALHPDSQG